MHDEPTTDRTGDDEHDEHAARTAAERMHATGTGDSDEPDPTGDHDPEALREAARRMHTER